MISKIKNIEYYKEHDWVLAQWDTKNNMVLVSPTGSGKSVIALRLIDKKFCLEKTGRALVICPTNLLADQLERSFKNFSEYGVLRVKDEKTSDVNQLKEICVCTGHRAAINYKKQLWSEETFSLVVFDEVHRMAAKNAPYAEVLKCLPDLSPLIGCTATLPAKLESKILSAFKVKEPLIGQTPISWTKNVYLEKINMNAYRRFLYHKTKKDILMTYEKLFKKQTNRDLKWYIEQPKSLFTIFKELTHKSFILQKLFKILFLRFFYFYECFETYHQYLEDKIKRKPVWPYLKLLKEYENEKFMKIWDMVKTGGSSTIVFMDNYKTLLSLRQYLNKKGCFNIITLGGKSKLKEKERKQTLQKLKVAENSVILTTSVAEEGIDIGSADTVILYRPVVNQIIYVQRKGRTGRHRAGKIYILYYDQTVEATTVNAIKQLSTSEDTLN